MSGSLIVWWPPSLPGCPTAWSEKPLPVVIRSDVQVGQAKVRRRYTRQRLTAQPQFIIARGGQQAFSQTYNTFITFFSADCQGGTRPFYFTHPWSKKLMVWRWVEEPTLTDHEIKFFRVACSWEEL